jgi:hypothetical protein
MAIRLDDFVAKLPEERQQAIRKQTADLILTKSTASGRVTLRASSDPACFSHSGQGLGSFLHDSG